MVQNRQLNVLVSVGIGKKESEPVTSDFNVVAILHFNIYHLVDFELPVKGLIGCQYCVFQVSTVASKLDMEWKLWDS